MRIITGIYIVPTLYIPHIHISPCPQGAYNLRPLSHMPKYMHEQIRANLGRNQWTCQYVFAVWLETHASTERTCKLHADAVSGQNSNLGLTTKPPCCSTFGVAPLHSLSLPPQRLVRELAGWSHCTHLHTESVLEPLLPTDVFRKV